MQINTPLPTISIERNNITPIGSARENSNQGSRNTALAPPSPPKSIEPAITQISRELTQELHTVEEADIDSQNDSIEGLIFIDSDGDGEITINDAVEVTIVNETIDEEPVASDTNNQMDTEDIGAVAADDEQNPTSTAEEEPEHSRVRMLTIPLKFLIERISGLVDIIDQLEDPESEITDTDINQKLMDGMVEMMMVQMYYMNSYMMDQMQNAPDYSLSEVYVEEAPLFV